MEKRSKNESERTTVVLKLNLGGHEEKDFTPLYEYIVKNYTGRDGCPALLFFDDVIPMLISDDKWHEALLLNRNANDMMKRIKKSIRKKGICITKNEYGMFWVPECRYDVLYNVTLDVCRLLHIPAPAVFCAYRMPELLKNGEESWGATYPGNKPYTTDIFVRYDEGREYMIKTLVHELRHAWQHKYHNDWFWDYTTAKKGDEYCLQTAELDADAFAYLYLEQYMDTTYMMQHLSTAVYKVLRKRINEIKEEGILEEYHPTPNLFGADYPLVQGLEYVGRSSLVF